MRELVRFTEQLQRVHPNVLAKALSRGIVHQDKELVVINKPYGLPVHGEEHVAGKGASVLLGLPWGLSGKESACQCRTCRFNPWAQKSPDGQH